MTEEPNKLEIATIYIRSLIAIPSLAAIAMYGMYMQQISDTVLSMIIFGIVSCVLMEYVTAAKSMNVTT
jgi:hypothetical protein